MNKPTNFFKDKPLFAFDLGHSTLKVMQVDTSGKAPRIIGYGTATFDPAAVVDGVVKQPEVIAKAMLDLFKKHLIGDITTHRVALTIPAYRAFARSMQLPKLGPKELKEAVQLEVEQYIPMPLDQLYLDYMVTAQTEDKSELFAVAVPQAIVDSYLQLTRIVGLEPVLIETTMSAAARLFALDKNSNVATVIIDFGTLTADISIFKQDVLVTGTVPAGGLVFTNAIRDKLGVTDSEAQLIKTKYGLAFSKKQKEVTTALEPTLQLLIKEIRRMMRYYEERYGNHQAIEQVVVLGGGANMPGLGEYLTSVLRLPVRSYDPWNHFVYKGLQPPSGPDKLMYATVAGLSLTNPRKVFVS